MATPDLRQQIASSIKTIQTHDALEADHAAFALRWVGSGSALFRTQKPATPDPHLVTYFPVVDPERGNILLVDHRNAGLWLPAGGHVEWNEHPRTTVEREVREELGIEATFAMDDPFFITVTRTVGDTATHTDVTLWYVLRCDATLNLRADPGEFFAVRWFAPSDIPYHRAEPHLARFLRKLSGVLSGFAPDSIASAHASRGMS